MSTAISNMETAIALAEAERHNAYGWIKPDAEACALCGKKEYATPVDGFQIQACGDCERPVCQDCAEVDYDGDSEGYRNTQWVCGPEARIECQRIADAERNMEAPKLEHPPLRSLWEIQAERYAHCDHEMVRDKTDSLRFARSRYVCTKGCGLTQEF